jgi:hypothetical protein
LTCSAPLHQRQVTAVAAVAAGTEAAAAAELEVAEVAVGNQVVEKPTID